MLKRVDALVKPLADLTFDPFAVKSQLQWKSVMDSFNKEVAAIEKEAINFIDESFKKLRSAQGAFDLLQKFKHIRSRQAINKQMLMKFDNILERYEKEVCPLLYQMFPMICFILLS